MSAVRRWPAANTVLDASALLCLLNREPGADAVISALPDAAISTVNLSEVIAKLAYVGMPEADIRDAVDGLPLEVVPFVEGHAYLAGMLRPQTAEIGLSLGDQACLALAAQLQLPAMTVDRAWADLQVGVQVLVIR